MRFRLTVLMGFAISVLLAAEAAELRTWTSTSGATISASYAGFENGVVVLKPEEGDLVQIHLNMLAPPDQEVARKLATAAGHISDLGSGVVRQSATNQLPAYIDGVYKGMHTVYESPYYRATIAADNLQLSIQPRDNGKDVGPVIRHGVGIHYGDLSKPPRQRHTPRRIATLDPFPAATMTQGRAHSVTVSGTLDHGVMFTRVFEFAPTTIRTSATMSDPAKIEYPSHGGYSVHFAQSLDEKKFDSLENIKAASAGWEITLNGRNMKATTFPFWPMIERVTDGVDAATFKGPWGTRTLHFDMPASRIRGGGNRFTRFGPVYAGRPALSGFNLGRSFALEPGEFSATYTITIE